MTYVPGMGYVKDRPIEPPDDTVDADCPECGGQLRIESRWSVACVDCEFVDEDEFPEPWDR
jgi:hypothetical protein